MPPPLLRSIWSRISRACWPLQQRISSPNPVTSQQAPPRLSRPTRMNGEPSEGCSDTGRFWLSFQLSLEAEFTWESHRAALQKMDHQALLIAAEALCRDHHLKQFLLDQYVRRVAELECREGLRAVDEHDPRMARSAVRDLGTG